MDVGRTDGHRRMVSDHNSSLSTPCSGELKTFETVDNIVENKVQTYTQDYKNKGQFDKKLKQIWCLSRKLIIELTKPYLCTVHLPQWEDISDVLSSFASDLNCTSMSSQRLQSHL